MPGRFAAVVVAALIALTWWSQASYSAPGQPAQSRTPGPYLPQLVAVGPSATSTSPPTVTASPTRTPTSSPTATATATATSSPTATRVPALPLPNGSFETGRDPWAFVNAGRTQGGAQDGAWYASITSLFGASISQSVTVPADRPYLSFWNQRYSFSNTCNVRGRVYVGNDVLTEYVFCQANQTAPGWQQVFVSLSAYAGQTVTLGFVIEEEIETDPDDRGLSGWWIDTVAFDVAP